MALDIPQISNFRDVFLEGRGNILMPVFQF